MQINITMPYLCDAFISLPCCQITWRYVADDRNLTIRTEKTSQRLDPVWW